MTEVVTLAGQKLHAARKVLVLTGAGVSAESGIPTFRGTGGLWEGFRAQELATPEAFARDPALVWRWYRWRRDLCRKAEPNPAHQALAKMESRFTEFLLATQNVDGLHRRAGSTKLVELHGNIDQARCTRCGVIVPLDEVPEAESRPVPSCSKCAASLRPHILWFGETYWAGTLDRVFAVALEAEVVIVVGTSAQVWPPAEAALRAKRAGAVLIDINPEATELSQAADLFLKGRAAELVPSLLLAADKASPVA